MKYLLPIVFLSISTAQSAPIKFGVWGSAPVIDVRAYDINNREINTFAARIQIGGDRSQTLNYVHTGPGQPTVSIYSSARATESVGITASSSSPENYDKTYFLAGIPFEPFNHPRPSVAPSNQIALSYSAGFDELIIISDPNTNIDHFEVDHKIQYGVNYVNDNPTDFLAQAKVEIDGFGTAITPGEGEEDFVFISHDFKPEESFSFETLYTRYLSLDQFKIFDSKLHSHEDFEIRTQVALNVSSVPIPATLWLFSSALIGLASVTHKKTSKKSII